MTYDGMDQSEAQSQDQSWTKPTSTKSSVLAAKKTAADAKALYVMKNFNVNCCRDGRNCPTKKECVDYHHGKEECRRNPNECYYTVDEALNEFERLFHPDKFRTTYCNDVDFGRKLKCYGEFCHKAQFQTLILIVFHHQFYQFLSIHQEVEITIVARKPTNYTIGVEVCPVHLRCMNMNSSSMKLRCTLWRISFFGKMLNRKLLISHALLN